MESPDQLATKALELQPADRRHLLDIILSSLDDVDGDSVAEAEARYGADGESRRRTVKSDYTAVIKQDGDWWIGWIEEVPGVNCQERTHDELMETLRTTLREALDLNRQEALSAAESDYHEEPLVV